ncbi:hypothetical protein SBOR_7877 [Sclerotinia borealis F-4128]|uniref:F-box domain-containing protein n=1 Tax=Sclerotinia borealis (strain F-4128) TaxID=1432307 RepID=W9C791_SCLBF|nr:hypothetical protein SBOR_7877 [Sclerotinia borealis F-4128]
MGAQESDIQNLDHQEENGKDTVIRALVPEASIKGASSLERLPTEALIKIIKYLPISEVSIAFTCPRMYQIFKDIHPRPISLCNIDVVKRIDHLDPYESANVHLLLQKYSPILRVYKPKDYIYTVISNLYVPAPCKDGDELHYRSQPYRTYEMYVTRWSEYMPKDFKFPYPHNKGRVAYKLEMKLAVDELLDSMDVTTGHEYMRRFFFLEKFLGVGSQAEVNELIRVNLTWKRYGEWRDMMGF